VTFPITPDPSVHTNVPAVHTPSAPMPNILGLIVGAVLHILASILNVIPIIGPIISGVLNSLANGFFPSASSVASSSLGSNDTSANLVFNATFETSASVAQNATWTWDGTVDHTGTKGSGSAKVTATGADQVLSSNGIAVSAGQAMNVTAWVQWQNLQYVAGDSPIWLGLQTYDSAGNVVSNPTLQQITNPPASSAWTELSGNYVVLSGVSSVAVTLNLGPEATGGVVWFDDVSAKTSGSPLISAVTGGNANTVSGAAGFTSDQNSVLGNPSGMGSPNNAANNTPPPPAQDPVSSIFSVIGSIILTPLSLFLSIFGGNSASSSHASTSAAKAAAAANAPSWLAQILGSSTGSTNVLNLFQQILNSGTSSSVSPNANSLVAFFQQILNVGGGSVGNAAVVSLMQQFLGTGTIASSAPLVAIQQVLNNSAASTRMVAYLQAMLTTSTGTNTLVSAFQNMLGGGVTGIANTSTFKINNALQGLLGNLLPAGALSSTTPVPASLLSALTPGTSNNVLPNSGGFPAQTVLDGQGLWIWDFPGKAGGVWGSPGCVRTRRPGTITIYHVFGAWEQSPGTPMPNGPTNLGDPKAVFKMFTSDIVYQQGMASPPTRGDNLIDWTHFEFIPVQYSAALEPMGSSVKDGTSTLLNLIESIPGKFIIQADAQGALIASNVYDEIRYGSLQNRNSDFLMAVCFGNLRRQQGRSFPNGPVYDSTGHGAYTPTLQNTEDRWWEWAIPAGTYPAFGSMTGVTFAKSDPLACSGSDANSVQFQGLIQQTMTS